MQRTLVFAFATLLAAATLRADALETRARQYLKDGIKAQDLGQYDKALKSFTLARDMGKMDQINDLLMRQILTLGADAALAAGRGDDAVSFAHDRIELAEKHGGADVDEAKMQLARAYALSGREPLAREIVSELRKKSPNDTGLARQLDSLVEEINSGKVAAARPRPGLPPGSAAAPEGIVYHTVEEEDAAKPAAAAPSAATAKAATTPKPATTAELKPTPKPAPTPKPTPTPRPTPAPKPAAAPTPKLEPKASPPPAPPAMALPATPMVAVAAGEFSQGDERGQVDEKPVRKVRISAFQLDATEVTNAAFAAFVKASGRKAEGDWQRYAPHDGDALPVRGVSWNDANAYCQKAGKRLPTEAEWEYAARGSEGRRYAYGDTFDATLACSGRKLEAGPCPAGKTKPTAAGVYNLTGNVLEWVSDWYDAKAYAGGAAQDPKGPATGAMKVLKGGAWDDAADASRAANRYSNRPSGHLLYYGFRCAQNAP